MQLIYMRKKSMDYDPNIALKRTTSNPGQGKIHNMLQSKGISWSLY